MGFEHTTLVVICNDCIGSSKSNYHAITIKTIPIVMGRRTILLIGGKKIYKQISGFFLNNARASLIIIQHNIRTQVLDTISIFIP